MLGGEKLGQIGFFDDGLMIMPLDYCCGPEPSLPSSTSAGAAPTTGATATPVPEGTITITVEPGTQEGRDRERGAQLGMARTAASEDAEGGDVVFKKGQGPSLAPDGRPVGWKSADAHWPVK